MNASRLLLNTVMVVAAVASVVAWGSDSPPTTQPGSAAASPLQFTVKTIDGQEAPLSAYRGKVVLIVNTASKCGLTPQYADLEALYRKHKDQGLVVLGFPCNDFNGQEPGTEADIKQFCAEKYDVSFPLFAKVIVKGDEAAPLYKFLTSEKTDGPFAGPIKWNFTKFLIARDGSVVKRIEPRTKVSDADVIAAIEAELARK